MRLIDKIHLEYTFLGSRGIRNELLNKDYKVGRSHIRTLMRKMGIEAISCYGTYGMMIFDWRLSGEHNQDHPKE